MKIGEFIQQGDVIVKRIQKVKGIKVNHLILAQGEVTGHVHTITKGEAELYEYEGTLFLRVNSEIAELTHQEHKTIVLSKGDYEIKKVREVDWINEEIRKVQD